MDSEANLASRTPAVWTLGEGRRPEEKIWMKTHLTMYAHVSDEHRVSLDITNVILQNGCWVGKKKAENVELV